ncbi:MAG: hypothetical protein IJZ29_04710 [Clostridia bacterium]|nr:hypothetical protein [Clostridia bacterium]
MNLFRRTSKEIKNVREQLRKIVENSTEACEVLVSLEILFEEVDKGDNKGLGFYLEQYKLHEEFYKSYQDKRFFSAVGLFENETKDKFLIQYLGFNGTDLVDSKLFKKRESIQQNETK